MKKNLTFYSIISILLTISVLVISCKTKDGGKSKDVERTLISSTSGDIEIIELEGGTSLQNQREIIKVAYTGEWPVNICGFVDIGDRLGISNHPGKATSIDYIDRDYFITRSIGKCVKYMKSREQVKVLLDIE